jgi:O-acetyl-ADP-ribose deacetylase (regulator of RNase III)
MIELTSGNLLEAPVQALVNTVNTHGVMGKGIALQFKQAFPQMNKAYEAACRSGEVELGQMHVFDLGGLGGGPRWIINFPTKTHWKARSRLPDIDLGLRDLIGTVRRLGIASIAVPPLGCGNGGLSWSDVLPRIQSAFEEVPNVQVLVYPPSGAPAASEMKTGTEKPDMTLGRAALIGLIRQYLGGLLDPFVTLLEIHKLMYFLQESGEPLRLKYEPSKFGPYARNLRQVMIRLEGHWLSGYGDGSDSPDKPIELINDAEESAERFLNQAPDVRERIQRVASLIDGYEDSYGLELLSSMHWVMCHSPGARESSEEAIAAVRNWNPGKKRRLKPEHLLKAWTRLKEAKWDTESRSAIQVKGSPRLS